MYIYCCKKCHIISLIMTKLKQMLHICDTQVKSKDLSFLSNL